MSVSTACLGHPRIGISRELKKALEGYWSGKATAEELATSASELRQRHWLLMKSKGIEHVPSNDFSLYDHMLDMAVCVGAIPERYQRISDSTRRYFAMARGLQSKTEGLDLAALEMTKWFDTNYHYIVPELASEQVFQLSATKILSEVEEARRLGLETRPVIIGPVSFLMLSKLRPDSPKSASPMDLLSALLPVYQELLRVLHEVNVEWVQLDEPCLVLDLDQRAKNAYERAFSLLTTTDSRPRLMLTTYFGPLDENLSLLAGSGCDGVHVDLVKAPDQLEAVLSALNGDTHLSLGLVDGRNVWRTDLDRAHSLLRKAVDALGSERLLVAPSCSLLHVPIDLDAENKLDAELRSWLAFAWQKLDEVRALASSAEAEFPDLAEYSQARDAIAGRRAAPAIRKPMVRARVAAVNEAMLSRGATFSERSPRQHARFGLPPLPTTTIGSFPQTKDVRGARAAHRAGRLSDHQYEEFLRAETRQAIERQEAIGLDVLVHGEFERTDMVEYFGERLEGFAITENGWVQSYGSRSVKPPLLFGDVARYEPMTVGWWRYAQSVTKQPMKAMLTGPVTILQWSFLRDDQPVSETCYQIALGLRDEVADLEAAGAGIIQVDEPALREGLPIRSNDRSEYLRWAVDAFRLTTSGVRDETQIHTHMCYSEFGDILDSISRMDADVISIETSRSRMELLSEFRRFQYPAEVGPGVYDIHSPRVPTTEEMLDLLRRACRVLPVSRLWVNPDCGLKTRAWPEVEAALRNLVQAAQLARQELAQTP